MRFNQREVAEHEAQLVAEALLQLFDHWVSLTAVRALVIAVLNEGYRRIGRALRMVVAGDGYA